MRRKYQLFRQYAQLLQNLTRMAMIEDRVGGKVLRYFHEMCFLRELFACPGNAGLGIADDAMVQVNQSCANQRKPAPG